MMWPKAVCEFDMRLHKTVVKAVNSIHSYFVTAECSGPSFMGHLSASGFSVRTAAEGVGSDLYSLPLGNRTVDSLHPFASHTTLSKTRYGTSAHTHVSGH